MNLIINGTTIPTNASITFDGNPVDKVICDGVTVWERIVNWTLPFGYPNYRGVVTQNHVNVNCGFSVGDSLIYMHCQDSSGVSGSVSVYYTTPVDITGLRYMKCTYQGVTTDWGINYCDFGFGLGSSTAGKPGIYYGMPRSTCSYTTFVLDISAYTGSYYPGFWMAVPSFPEYGRSSVTNYVSKVEFTN